MNNNKLGAQDDDRLVNRNGKAVRDWRIAAMAKQELNPPLAAGQGSSLQDRTATNKRHSKHKKRQDKTDGGN